MDKMTANFCREFAWNGEELWIETFKLDHYRAMLNDMVERGKDWVEVQAYWEERFASFTSKAYNVRENSTGALHREASTFKFLANMDLLEWIKGI
jgi:hypothetical protein